MRSNIAFGTNSRKTLPFDVAGLTFFSRPLTAAEDLIFLDLADRYDLSNTDEINMADFMGEQMDGLAGVLQSRVLGDPRPLVDTAWVGQHLSTNSFQNIMVLLRTGQRPDGEINLVDWEEGTFTVQEREFCSRKFSFYEQQQAARLNFDGSNRAIITSGIGFVTDMLNTRIQDGGEAVTAEWMWENLTANDVMNLVTFLQSGPEALSDPNAEEAEVTAEADAGVDGSAISAA